MSKKEVQSEWVEVGGSSSERLSAENTVIIGYLIDCRRVSTKKFNKESIMYRFADRKTRELFEVWGGAVMDNRMTDGKGSINPQLKGRLVRCTWKGIKQGDNGKYADISVEMSRTDSLTEKELQTLLPF